MPYAVVQKAMATAKRDSDLDKSIRTFTDMVAMYRCVDNMKSGFERHG